MPSDSLIQAADNYLKGRKTVLWAHHTIDRDEERAKAARWLAEQVEGVLIERASPTLTWHDQGFVG